jgi:peptidoglycan/LPS O-acetylase OafA/YrhL
MLQQRMPSLDGWRGMSVLLVVLGHQISLSRKHFGYNPKILNLLEFHHYGVQVFFVISGFIITRLLIREAGEQGTISLRDFYVRRVFRILPAYYFFLITIFIITRMDIPCDTKDQHLVKAFLFLSNFKFWGVTWPVGHTWSLAVEEQFYLLWPITFMRSNLKVVPFIFVCAAPLFRIIGHLYPDTIFHLSFIVNADAIFWGALFAIYIDKPAFAQFMKYGKWILGFTCALILIERFSIKGVSFITVPFLKTFFSLSIIILIYYSLNSASVLYRFFNNRVLVFIGVISYSIYLWQQIFYYEAPVLNKSFITIFPLNWVFIAGVSYGSYLFIEQPFLKLRKRFLPAPQKKAAVAQ